MKNLCRQLKLQRVSGRLGFEWFELNLAHIALSAVLDLADHKTAIGLHMEKNYSAAAHALQVQLLDLRRAPQLQLE